MKSLQLFILCFIIGLIPNFSSAQDKDLAKVSLQKLGTKVLLEITVYQGNVCNGMSIYRGSDSLNFEKIGAINGSCGSQNVTIVYDYEDDSPDLNKVNYYYVQLEGIGPSPVSSILVIDAKADNYVLWPNPVRDTCSIHFVNPLNENVNLNVYSLDGQLVSSYSSQESVFHLDVSTFEKGTFIFSLSSPNRNQFASGKIVVVH